MPEPRDYTICDCGHDAALHAHDGCEARDGRFCRCPQTANDLIRAAVAAARVDAARTIAAAIRGSKASSAGAAALIADDHADRWAGEQ